MLAHRLERESPQVLAVERDDAGRRVVEPHEQPRERGLARAARADDRQRLARPRLERDVADGVDGRAGVAVGDAAQRHEPVGVGERTRVRPVGDGGALLEQLDDPLGARGGGEHRRRQARELPHRRVEAPEERDEHEQLAQRERLAAQQPDPAGEHRHRTEELDQVGDRGEHRADARDRELGVHDPLGLVAEALELGPLAVEALDEGDVAEALLGDGGERAGPSALLARRVLDELREVARRDERERRDDERQQRELPGDEEQHAAEDQDADDRGDAVGDPGEQERLDRRDVRRDARQRVAEPPAVEGVGREALDVREQVGAHVEEEPLADPGREDVVAEREHRPEERQPDVRERDREEHPEVARDEHLVDDDAEQPDLRRLDGRDGEQRQQAESDAPAVRARERPEAPQELSDGDLRRGGDVALPVRDGDEQGLEASGDGGLPSGPCGCASTSSCRAGDGGARRRGWPGDPSGSGSRCWTSWRGAPGRLRRTA